MQLIEILLPLKRNDGAPQAEGLFGEVRQALIDKFGGLTAFTRAPAEGLWESGDGEVDRDSIVIFEVMADRIDRQWWRSFRALLERRFEQDVVLIRARAVELL